MEASILSARYRAMTRAEINPLDEEIITSAVVRKQHSVYRPDKDLIH